MENKAMVAILSAFFLMFFVKQSSAYSKKSDPVIAGINIEITGACKDKDKLKALAKNLITLKKGMVFNGKDLADSLGNLKNSKIFKTIEIPDPDWEKPEITLLFKLTPFPGIKNVKIYGAFPLLEREVLNAMNLYPGDPFEKNKLPKKEAALVNLFKGKGFINPKVHITARKDPEDGNFILEVNIDKGDFFRIDIVKTEGNKSYSNARLKLMLKSWHSSLFFGEISKFDSKTLKGDVEKLVEFYRKKGYADVKVESKIEKDEKTNLVTIRLIIDEGPWYDIEFDGNKEFWDMTLNKDMVIYKRGNKGDLGLRRSLKKIKKRYYEAGYLNSKITMKEEKKTKNGFVIRKIKILIDEGPRSIVKSIKIDGNKAFEEEKISDQMITTTPGIIASGAFVPKVFKEDKQSIKTLYMTKGYLKADVKDKIKWRDDDEKNEKLGEIFLHINENIRTDVADVRFYGLGVIDEKTAMDVISLKPGQPFRKYMIKSDENILSSIISEKGYPHVRVKGEAKISKDGAKAHIIYKIDPGPYVTVGKIYFTGNFRTKEYVLKREIDLKEGAPFSLKKMLEANKTIRDLNALETAEINPIGLKNKASKVDLLIKVEEKKPYFFEVGGGYDTRRKIFIHSKIGDRNLFGLNMNSWAGAQLSQIGYRGDINITEPRIFGSRISTTFNIFAEKEEEFNKNFGTRSFGSSLGFNRKFLKYFSANLSFRYEGREQYLLDDTAVAPEDEKLYDLRSIFVVTPAITYNSTDSFSRPTKGIFSLASVDISKGLDNNLDDFFKYRFEVRYFYTPVKRLTFAMRGRIGYLSPYGSNTSIPEDQLFFLGGTSDVRGYRENLLRFDEDGSPLGGKREVLGTIEARIDIGFNFEFSLFYDIGSVQDAPCSPEDDEYRSSVGVGLRYMTPIGPIGLLYGHKLDRKEGESPGRFHFSMGYTF